MKTKWVIAGAVLLSVVIAAFVLFSRGPDDVKLFSDVKLRLRWTHQAQFAGIYVAQEKGLFADANIKLEVLESGRGVNFMQLVGSGVEKFGICGAAQIVEGRDRGLPVKAIAIIYQDNPNIFFSRKDSGITTPKEWSGKKVAVYKGFDNEYIFRALCAEAGLKPGDVIEYPAGPDMMPFLQGLVDVWAGYKINQPLRAEEEGIEINRIDPGSYGIKVPGDTLFTSEDVIKTDPELCQRMVNAILDGWKYALTHQEEAVSIVVKRSAQLKKEHEGRMLEEVAKLTPLDDPTRPLGSMSEEQWNDVIKIWKTHGGIKNEVNAGDCFVPTYVDRYWRKHQN
jgi:NitT/TauT family transport system substrate-binding protein